jgi:hypothetical protein
MILIPILLIIGGVLAASSLIVQKQPNARELIGKLVPFQGIIGIALLVWGLFALIFWVLPSLGWIMRWSFVSGLVMLLSVLVTIALGFLLGYGLIAQHLLSKNADAARSGQAAHAKLVGYQVPLGIIGIVLGLWALISYLMAPYPTMVVY